LKLFPDALPLKPASRSILLIGLDGFDPDLTRRWIADGSLPNLAKISQQGCFVPLHSTIPPFTYPAWSSLMTGVNPGRHGIIDFAVRRPGSYSVSYINSTYRLEPTIFNRLSAAGKRVAAIGFPTSYPPEPVNGIMISGFDSPLAYTADRSFCYPESIWDELKTGVSAYTLAGIQELNTGSNWRSKARQTICDTISTRTDIAEYLYTKERWDLFGIVFSESDTAAHHFWAAHDPQSPRHRPGDAMYSGFLRDVYQSLDHSVGRLIRLADSDTHVLVVSDHGSGGTGNRLISLNRMLASKGFFVYRKNRFRRSPVSADNHTVPPEPDCIMQSRLRKLAFRVPARAGEWLFRYGPRRFLQFIESKNRLAQADLKNCTAFSDELNYFPSIWLNDDRFPLGKHFDPQQRTDVLDTIKSTLLDCRDPVTGMALIRDVYFKNELFNGPALEWIPDLVVIPAMDGDYTLNVWNAPCPGPVLSKLPETEIQGRKGGSMNGSHRQFGVLIANARLCQIEKQVPRLEDIGASILALAGFDIDGLHLDGRSLFDIRKSTRTDISFNKRLFCKTGDQPVGYTEKEANEIEQRLKRLGYL
jgi:predicted AlkP superfamily phosphohydrolase/phosphomutase